MYSFTDLSFLMTVQHPALIHQKIDEENQKSQSMEYSFQVRKY